MGNEKKSDDISQAKDLRKETSTKFSPEEFMDPVGRAARSLSSAAIPTSNLSKSKPQMMRRIVFSVTAVRHGQAASNDIETGVVHGCTESPLTEEGKRQAVKVAESLRDEVFDAVYSSDLSRAYDTCLAIVGAERRLIQTEPLLRERDFGRFENAPWSVFKQAVAKAGCESPKDFGEFEDESMESLDCDEERAGTFLKKLFQRSAGEWG